jgi:two-component system chemotaxis sensor kinase CheA
MSDERQQIREANELVPDPPPPSQEVAFGSLAQDPELVRDFLVEARDHLSAVESGVLVLEQTPGKLEAIHAIFRGFHTIKGLAGFLEFAAMQEVAHETENLLDLARNGKLTVTPEVIDAVLAGADFLAKWLDRIEAALGGGPVPAEPPSEALRARIQAMAAAPGEGGPVARLAAAVEAPPEEKAALAEAVPPVEAAPIVRAAPAAPVPDAVLEPAAESVPAEEARRKKKEEAPPAGGEGDSKLVKVDTAKLDYLVDMAGELVIAQSLVRHDPSLGELKNSRLNRNLGQLSRITDELQKTAMSMRMVPINQLFRKMARLVRDLSRKSGKQTELITSGDETELDRHIVEELADPLMHMVRNALDHGIDPPAERAAAAKPACATVRLSAAHQSGHIVVEIADDGRGLNREKILRKGIERGLVAEGVDLSDSDVYNLIFQPGFSTAEQITDVSGRGVGMDVVRKRIQKLRGRVEIQSELGKGTTFLLKLPLTLAIIDGLVVAVGRERYILPIFVVKEILRPTEDMVFTVEDRDEMVLVRGRLLPVVRLARRFGVVPKSDVPSESVLVISEAGDRTFCLMVDELIGKQEVVIKSLGETLKNIRGIAGGAILGDGRVGLILDIDTIFREGMHGLG